MIVDIEQDAVVLLGHGSRDRSAIEESDRFLTYFRRWSGLKTVDQGYLEQVSPSIPEAIDRAVSKGAARVRALPLFLFPGRHIQSDLPRLLSEAQARHPRVAFFLGEALSRHPKLMELAQIRIASVETAPLDETDPPGALRKRGVLIVGRGSRSPEGAAAIEGWGRALERLIPDRHVTYGFADVSPPTISEAVSQAIRNGVQSLIVFPAILFSGAVFQSIQEQIRTAQTRGAACSIRIAPPFGNHPLLAEAVWEGIKRSPLLSPGEERCLQEP